jgi:hypothetical protein
LEQCIEPPRPSFNYPRMLHQTRGMEELSKRACHSLLGPQFPLSPSRSESLRVGDANCRSECSLCRVQPRSWLEEGNANAANVDCENARRVAARTRISGVFSRRSINAPPVVRNARDSVSLVTRFHAENGRRESRWRLTSAIPYPACSIGGLAQKNSGILRRIFQIHGMVPHYLYLAIRIPTRTAL